jgi:hypothetical protein
MCDMSNYLKRGTQIIYLPDHVEGDIHHKDSEPGFVITDKGDSVFCRYFCKGFLIGDLRTVANSELTPKENLVVKDIYRQDIVDRWVKRIEADPEIYGHIDKEQSQ